MSPTTIGLLMYGGLAIIPIAAVVYAFYIKKKSYSETYKARLFDLELLKRGMGWIKIQPTEAVHVSDVASWDEKHRILQMKDGSKKKVHKVWALTMEKEIHFAKSMLENNNA
ncbi:hypothetical protein NBRC13296_12425 [Paenibacillus chitinolyticus]|uniref:hypothetical protein n=1 Tax=Paenibacillus chitinolyticus TaxID=79263 RepID=UPI00355631E1